MSGCGANGTAGSGDALVEQVDRGTLESQLLYYDPVVSARPLTAAEMGDTSGAMPVRIEFLDTVAVAWLAPNGVVTYNNASIVAIFPIASSSDGFGDITPATDTTHSVPTIPRATGPSGGGGIGSHGSTLTPGGVGGNEVALPGLTTSLTQTFLRWQNIISQNPSLSRQVGSYHPGCG